MIVSAQGQIFQEGAGEGIKFHYVGTYEADSYGLTVSNRLYLVGWMVGPCIEVLSRIGWFDK